MAIMVLQVLPGEFSVCRIEDISKVDLRQELVFLCKTDEEMSLVCAADAVPENVVSAEHGWRVFRIAGVLDFSLVGVLAPILRILAEHKISVFVVSTYNTDYVLLKKELFAEALKVLRANDYKIEGL